MTIHVMDNGSLVPLADIQYFDGEYHRIKEVWQWTGSEYVQIHLWVPPPFSPSGMTKNGAWASNFTYPWITVPEWTADAGSTVVSDGVSARGTKSDAVVTSQVRVRNTASGGNECAMRILVGGVVVKTGSVVSMGGSQTVNLTLASDPISVTTDQVATVQIQGQYGRLEVQAGTDTWVRIT